MCVSPNKDAVNLATPELKKSLELLSVLEITMWLSGALSGKKIKKGDSRRHFESPELGPNALQFS